VAAIRRVVLGTAAMTPALRQPVLAVRAIATLDVLFAGRAAIRSPDGQAAERRTCVAGNWPAS
jgi:hypothetical protein